MNIIDQEYDLVVLGIGNSLFQPLLTDNLIHLLDKSKKAIGIFGTQYRNQISNKKMEEVICRLDFWYARYREDIEFYGANKNNVFHLGDWLIDAFPLSESTDARILKIGDEIWKDLPLDRTIQQIQTHKKVFSTRLHPLLCALTSAKEVAYTEQPNSFNEPSGKFKSMLLDIFKKTYKEKIYFEVDHNAVLEYKIMVRENIRNLELIIGKLLND